MWIVWLTKVSWWHCWVKVTLILCIIHLLEALPGHTHAFLIFAYLVYSPSFFLNPLPACYKESYAVNSYSDLYRQWNACKRLPWWAPPSPTHTPPSLFLKCCWAYFCVNEPITKDYHSFKGHSKQRTIDRHSIINRLSAIFFNSFML